MSKKITIPTSIIRLKDKTEIEVSRETGEKIMEGLTDADGHRFVQISEIGRMINSAEIKEVVPSTKTEYVPEEPEKPLTEAQRKSRTRKLADMRSDLEKRGVLPKKI